MFLLLNSKEIMGYSYCITYLLLFTYFLADTSKCQFLDAPTNGFVVIGGFQHGNNVTYFCNADYVLMHGDHVRQCMTDGQWSGSAPSCEGMLFFKLYIDKKPNVCS